jgi:hypothetical protein
MRRRAALRDMIHDLRSRPCAWYTPAQHESGSAHDLRDLRCTLSPDSSNSRERSDAALREVGYREHMAIFELEGDERAYHSMPCRSSATY